MENILLEKYRYQISLGNIVNTLFYLYFLQTKSCHKPILQSNGLLENEAGCEQNLDCVHTMPVDFENGRF